MIEDYEVEYHTVDRWWEVWECV